MIVYRVKLERAVIFIKYIASTVSLIFPSESLIWSKVVLPASDLMNFLGMVKNVLKKTLYVSI